MRDQKENDEVKPVKQSLFGKGSPLQKEVTQISREEIGLTPTLLHTFSTPIYYHQSDIETLDWHRELKKAILDEYEIDPAAFQAGWNKECLTKRDWPAFKLFQNFLNKELCSLMSTLHGRFAEKFSWELM